MSVTRKHQPVPFTSSADVLAASIASTGDPNTDGTEATFAFLVDENNPTAKVPIATVAQDGTDSTDINATQATGGVGIRGWLSTLVSLFRSGNAKVKLTDGSNVAAVTLASAVKVDGSAVTQPISGSVSVAGTTTITPVDINGNNITDQGGRIAVNAVLAPPGRRGLGSIIFVEDGRHPVLGMWNDGSGVAYRDNEVPFNGRASIRLDGQGNFSSGSTFGATVDSHGVVFKRRIAGNYGSVNSAGVYRWSGWIRWTSQNNHGSQWTGVSVYNRDGTNIFIGRLWLDPTITSGTQIQVNYLGSDGLFHALSPVQNFAVNLHNYDLPNIAANNVLGFDIAGGWHYWSLEVDMGNKLYRKIQFNENVWDLTGTSTYQTASTSAKMFHFSVEYLPRNSGGRFINVANMVAEQIG